MHTLLRVLACATTLTVLVPAFAQEICTDDDTDGFFSQAQCGSAIDCNDGDWNTHPYSVESCNAYDDNCDGTVDEGCTTTCNNPQRRPAVLSVTPLPGGSQYMPDLARGPRRLAVSRADWDSANCYRCAVTLLDDANREQGPPLILKGISGRSAIGRQTYSAWMGDRFIVVWGEGLADDNCEPVGSDSQVYFSIISPGNAIVVPPTRLSCSGGAGGRAAPGAVVWSGNSAIISFGQQGGAANFNGTWLTRVTADGEILDGCGVRISLTTDQHDLAWNGNELALVSDPIVLDAPPSAPEIFFQRFTSSLIPIDATPRRMTFEMTRSVEPRIVWGPGEWAVAWTQDFVPGYQDIGFMRISSAGELVAPPGVLKATSGAELPGANDRLSPSIAWSGSEYGIAYFENSNITGSGDIKLSRISAAGVDLGVDPVLTPDTLRNAMFPQLVWNGVDYTMAWQDRTTANGPYESLVAHIGCNCSDADHDGFSTCGGDCDDTRFQVRPGGNEACANGLDDNCDGRTDCQDKVRCAASGALPDAPSGLMIAADRQTISWQPVAAASRYDVARGSLAHLRTEGSVASAGCLSPDTTQTVVSDPQVPPLLNGFFYVVRSEAGTPNQCRQSEWGVADEASINACP